MFSTSWDFMLSQLLFLSRDLCVSFHKRIKMFVTYHNCYLSTFRILDFSFMAEHTDLRKIMGLGIAISRGSASALSFCYCLLLLSVSKNLITKLKAMSLHQYIPLDSHLQFHKICALTALFFSLVHTVAHMVNFYHLGTQPAHHLQCMSKADM